MKIAVDAALLPPENIMDVCIELNRKFNPTSNLNKIDNFPHITLAMGVINKEDIPKVNEKLQEIVSKFKTLDLELEEIYHTIKPDGNKSFAFAISKTDELIKLHAIIMKELLPIFTYEVTTDMFDQTDPIDPISIRWVENYGKHHENPENYVPHLTIKCKKNVETDLKFPIKFTASKFGLFHLGDHCTCRTSFGLFELK